ncbi:MAG: hypothetical protein AAF697_10965 [Pseudomonadota bacterium]
MLERIDRRVPIKVIARELEVSETRINQHIRALKNLYEVESLGDLVDAYREENHEMVGAEESQETSEDQTVARNLKASGKAIYRKSQIPGPELADDIEHRNDPGELVLSDAFPLEEPAPWLRTGEPRVVPRVLDGENAVWVRLIAIVGIAFGILAAVVLTVTAAITISEALDGRADVPLDEQGFS